MFMEAELCKATDTTVRKVECGTRIFRRLPESRFINSVFKYAIVNTDTFGL